MLLQLFYSAPITKLPNPQSNSENFSIWRICTNENSVEYGKCVGINFCDLWEIDTSEE